MVMTNQSIEGRAAEHANINNPGGASAGEIALFSIAISLKRIADVMKGTAEEAGLAWIMGEMLSAMNKD